MKFAHFSDVHIGAWRDPRLRDVNLECFSKAIEQCVTERVDFVLISGDLFNTSMPTIEHLRGVVLLLKQLKEQGIGVYYIAGSHDFSPSGKTMLDVLHAAGLAQNVARGEEVGGKLRLKFTTDPRTGVKIAGMLGKKGGLETEYYSHLDYSALEEESGPKVFLFHSAIAEMKPAHLEQMPAMPLSVLPRGFDYYAGGHVHVVAEHTFEFHKHVVFPGPIFPCSFSELEQPGRGGYYLVEDLKPRYVPLEVYPVKTFTLDCTGKTPAVIEESVLNVLRSADLERALVGLRLYGRIQGGRVSDLNYKEIMRLCSEKRVKSFLRNTYMLTSADLDAVRTTAGSIEEVEARLIEENVGQLQTYPVETERKLIPQLLHALAVEKNEGETTTAFEKRLQEELDVLFCE